MNSKNLLTDMPIGKALFILSLPIVISNLLQTAYQLTDAYWIGHLGADAVATVTVAGMVIFLTISLGSGLSIAGSILIAQYFGAKKWQKVNHIARQTLLMIIFTSIFLGVIGFIFAKQIVLIIGVDENILSQTVSFVRINFIGLIFSFSFFMFQSIMRGIGRPNIPIFIVGFTLIINFLLNPFLIWTLKFGVIGSAITTLISQSIATIIGFLILFSGKYGIKLSFKDFIPDKKAIKTSFLLGYPSSIEMIARSLGILIVTGIVALFGTKAIAGFGAAGNVLQVVIIFAMGLSMATSILVGQNIGAGNIKKAKKVNFISALVSFGLMTSLGIISFIFAPNIVKFFIPNDNEVVLIGSEIIRISSLFFGLIGVQMSFTGVLRAIGKTKIPMITTILSQWILKLPIAYLLSHYTFLKLSGVWWSDPIVSIIMTIIVFIIMLKIDWSKSNMTKDEKLEKDVIEGIMIEEPAKG
ncbi:MATE family efflux transporter [Candidatus Gracilibacteria bacterium]|nr:MATE family efflux transporter [Candidatus Gracilibacteria bacterium]